MPLEYPDNTMAGFAAAASVVPMVELDVRRSRDGRLVLSHDPHINDVTVANATWSELSLIDVGDGHRPALLDDVLQDVPGLALDIEIKNWPVEPGFEPDHRTALEVAALLRPGDMLTSFFWPTVDAVQDAFPGAATGLLVDRSGSIADAVTHALEHGHGAIAPHFSLLSEELVAGAMAAGLAVATWTVNDVGEAVAFATWGVSTIISDDVRTIAAALEGR